jgi:hypothetical protein
MGSGNTLFLVTQGFHLFQLSIGRPTQGGSIPCNHSSAKECLTYREGKESAELLWNTYLELKNQKSYPGILTWSLRTC